MPAKHAVISVMISLFVLTISLYVLLSQNYDATVQVAAFGCITLVANYWLQNSKKSGK